MINLCVPPCVGGWPIKESGDGGLLEVEGRGVLQDLIPYVGHLAFPQVPVEIWVTDIGEHGLLDCPGDTICFPAYNGEAAHTDEVSCRLALLVNGEGLLRCSFSLSPKVLFDSPVYSSFHPALVYLNWYITPLICVMVSLSFVHFGKYGPP